MGTPLMMKAAEEETLLPFKTKTEEPVAFTKKMPEEDAVFTERVLVRVPVVFVKKRLVVEAVKTFNEVVPVAFVKVKFERVEEGDHSCVEEAPAPENWWNPVQRGAIVTESAGAASLLIKVLAEPLTAVRPTDAVGFAPVELETSSPVATWM